MFGVINLLFSIFFELKPTMDIEKSVNLILHSIRQSNLHYSAQKTPHSIYFSIRKKLLNISSVIQKPTSLNSISYEEQLEEKCKKLENQIESIKNNFEKEIEDHQKVLKESN